VAACAAVASFVHPAFASPVTYKASVFTDINFRGKHYHNADLTLTFVGDTADIAPYNVTDANGNIGSGLWIKKGRASLSFESNGKTVSAEFAPGQLYVSVDSYNSGFGFGSQYGPAYPLALDSGTAAYFASSDLASSLDVSGNAWSCIGFPVDPYYGGTGNCKAPDAFPLKTNKGKLIVYQPYNNLNSDGTLCGDHCGALNRATFSISPGSASE